MINSDPSNYYILASNLTSWGDQPFLGGTVRVRQGFGYHDQNGYRRLRVQLSTWIDRDLNNRLSSAEPVFFITEDVHLSNNDTSPPQPVPDTLLYPPTNNMITVRDSAFPRIPGLGSALLMR